MFSYTINEWCKMHRISRGQFYILQKRGMAPATFRIGKLVRISEEANRFWMQTQESGSVDPYHTKCP